MMPLRLVLAATGEIALPVLGVLASSEQREYSLLGLITQPDKPVGRHAVLTAPKVKEIALARAVPVWQPEKIRDRSFLEKIAALKPDLIIVMAYGQILRQELLDLPRYGCWNLHASLLPRHRGASCIQAAIREGDAQTGWSLMQMDAGLDTGDVLLQESLQIGTAETAGELHDKLASLALGILGRGLRLLQQGGLSPEKQSNSKATYAPRLERADGRINWTESAESIERLIRAYAPWPGTHCFLERKGQKKEKIKVFPNTKVLFWEQEKKRLPGEILQINAEGITISCGENALTLCSLQREGRQRLAVEPFLRGFPLHLGEVLT